MNILIDTCLHGIIKDSMPHIYIVNIVKLRYCISISAIKIHLIYQIICSKLAFFVYDRIDLVKTAYPAVYFALLNRFEIKLTYLSNCTNFPFKSLFRPSRYLGY